MKLQYRHFRAVCLTLFGCACITAFAQQDLDSTLTEEVVTAPVLTPLDVHPRTSLTVVEQLRYNHYVKKPLDDGISSDIFDKYLDSLDGGRAYFLAADVQEFEQYRYTLDDALKRANLEPAFEMFNRYQTRAVERLQYLLSELNAGIDDMDFSIDESLEIDRKHARNRLTDRERIDLLIDAN